MCFIVFLCGWLNGVEEVTIDSHQHRSAVGDAPRGSLAFSSAGVAQIFGRI